MWVGGLRHAPTALTTGKRPVLMVEEAAWAPRPVSTGDKNLAPTGIRSPAPPARSESLYGLSQFSYVQVKYDEITISLLIHMS